MAGCDLNEAFSDFDCRVMTRNDYNITLFTISINILQTNMQTNT